MNWVVIEESPSHVAYDTTMYRNWYDDSDGDWDDDCDDYSDEDEDWESEWEWYEQLYKWGINAL